MVAFCHVCKKQLDGRNWVSWKALKFSPNDIKTCNILLMVLKRNATFMRVGMSKNTSHWGAGAEITWEYQNKDVFDSCDVTRGSSFLRELWNPNKPFSEMSADFGSYLGKYWSVLVPVKRIFSLKWALHNTSDKYPLNFPFKQLSRSNTFKLRVARLQFCFLRITQKRTFGIFGIIFPGTRGSKI